MNAIVKNNIGGSTPGPMSDSTETLFFPALATRSAIIVVVAIILICRFPRFIFLSLDCRHPNASKMEKLMIVLKRRFM
jgi:hypothetical protein